VEKKSTPSKRPQLDPTKLKDWQIAEAAEETMKPVGKLAEEMGLRPQRRPVHVEEIFTFQEAGCCGTAAVITPVGSITFRDRKVVYSKDGRPGRYSVELYQRLKAIQLGDMPDKHGWVRRIPPA